MDCPQAAISLNHTPLAVCIHHQDRQGLDALTVFEPVLPLHRALGNGDEWNPRFNRRIPLRHTTAVRTACVGLPMRRYGEG